MLRCYVIKSIWAWWRVLSQCLMMSSRVRERHRGKKRASKINSITALCSVSLRHNLISSKNGSVMFPALLSVIMEYPENVDQSQFGYMFESCRSAWVFEDRQPERSRLTNARWRVLTDEHRHNNINPSANIASSRSLKHTHTDSHTHFLSFCNTIICDSNDRRSSFAGCLHDYFKPRSYGVRANTGLWCSSRLPNIEHILKKNKWLFLLSHILNLCFTPTNGPQCCCWGAALSVTCEFRKMCNKFLIKMWKSLRLWNIYIV